VFCEGLFTEPIALFSISVATMVSPRYHRGHRLRAARNRQREDKNVSNNLALLIRRAKMILDFNRVGSYTQPGPRLYPHQWSWDSAFIAIGYAHYDQRRATNELNHLLDSQWKNGLLPQIVFNPNFSEYFPGVGFWHAERSPDAPRHHKTSGLVQPPVHATAALHVYRLAKDDAYAQAFLAGAFPRLRAWHEYLYRERDPDGKGLVYIRHPWESGMDNSPMWDETLLRIHLKPDEIPGYRRVDTHLVDTEARPVSAAYDRFAWLIQLFADRDYDETRIRVDCPFLVQDVLFNTLLCQADRDLAELARAVGEDPSPLQARADRTARAINERLWDEERGIYLDFDLVTSEPIRVHAAAGFSPLYASIPDEVRARRPVRLRVLAGPVLARTGLDQHKLGTLARPRTLRLRQAGRLPAPDHNRPYRGRGLLRVLPSHERDRPRLGLLLLDGRPAPRHTLRRSAKDQRPRSKSRR
jgi:hypothetical protein